MFISKIILLIATTILTGNGLNTKTVCEGQGPANIDCPENSSIQIFKNGTFYGRQLPFSDVCPSYGKEVLDCTGNGTDYEFISDLCSGKSSCKIEVTNSIFGDPCKHVYKYLQVKYGCVADEITVPPAPYFIKKNKNKICIGDSLNINNPIANNPHKTKEPDLCKKFCSNKHKCAGFYFKNKKCRFFKNIKKMKKDKGAICFVKNENTLPPLRRINNMRCYGTIIKQKTRAQIRNLKDCKAQCDIYTCDGFNFSKKRCILFSKVKAVMRIKKTTCFIRHIAKEPQIYEDKFH
jgi:hypothetical protein